MIESCSSCRTSFCRPCLQSGGARTTHFSKAEISACTQREHRQIGTTWHIQRGSSIRDFSGNSRRKSTSTAEAEYIAAADCCTQILWMKEALKDVDICTDQPITVYCDNKSAISLSKKPVMHSRTKHIPIKYHFLREQVVK